MSSRMHWFAYLNDLVESLAMQTMFSINWDLGNILVAARNIAHNKP